MIWFEKWKTKRYLRQGYTVGELSGPHSVVKVRLPKGTIREISVSIYGNGKGKPTEIEEIELEDSIPSANTLWELGSSSIASGSITSTKLAAEGKKDTSQALHLPDFLNRGDFYEERIAAALEEVSRSSGISYNFFKERYIVGDGRCWVCGGKLKKEDHFFCPWHNVDAKENIKDVKDINIQRIAEWSVGHEDFKLPSDYLCPKCEDRPQAVGDYLCNFCRGHEQT
jgi:hypothetical protein